jgi:hypothetical protein
MAKKSEKKNKSLSNNKTNKLQKQIIELLKQKRGINLQLEEIIKEYLNLLPSNKEDLSKWYSELPIKSLSDLCEHEDGRDNLTNLEKIEMRSKLRTDREDALEQVETLKSQITISTIDLLLEKIKLVEKELDKNG